MTSDFSKHTVSKLEGFPGKYLKLESNSYEFCFSFPPHKRNFKTCDFELLSEAALRLLDLRLVMDEPLKSSDDEDRIESDDESAEQERQEVYDDLFEDFFTSKMLH